MRRWIFAALLLANLGMLMWGAQYVETERQQPQTAADPVNPEKMRLLRDIPPKGGRKPDSAETAAKLPASLTTGSAPVCYRLGPLIDVVQIQKLEQLLSGQSIPHTRREEGMRTVSGYRVYLPPFPSKEEAERTRRDLSRLGFKDHAVIHGEGLDNAVSLGLFSVEANAKNRVSQLAQKGVDAKMESFEQTLPAYSWDLGPIDSPEARTRFTAILEGVSSVEIRDLPCPTTPAATRPVTEPAPRH